MKVSQESEEETLKMGSLFSGMGGLDLGVEHVFNTELVWFSEFDKNPAKVLQKRFPSIPNLGDVTKIDWSQVEPVDILIGGSPCQDVSQAGRRAGMTDGTRSNLWVAMREAIEILQPTWVVWENVRGALSAKAKSASDGDMESEERLVGERRAQLKALGRVLGDLTSLGYDAEWRVVRASDVGAPHQRARVFVLAHANSDEPQR